jgi:hypothetical protein
MRNKIFFKVCIRLCLLSAIVYGGGRLYYQITAGFTTGNIASELPYDSRFETKALAQDEKNLVDSILSQPFHYLGKGCQSYVFASEDGKYVLKFFKYQRFTPQKWIEYFSFIPQVEEYRLSKVEEKKKKLENIFTSWKLAFDELQKETGLIFVHLNKTSNLKKELVIYDKMGMKHDLPIDNYEFLIQKRANMLTETIDEHMAKGQEKKAKALLDNLYSTILSEYERGVGDNDHALMQNTGVLDGMPIHIDVGQFMRKESYKDISIQQQEIFNKSYKFRMWLKKRYPDLSSYVDEKLYSFIGPKMDELKPQLKNMGFDEL